MSDTRVPEEGAPALRVFADHRSAAVAALDRCESILAGVPEDRGARLALPTGRSFVPFYAELAARHPRDGARGETSARWRRAQGLNLDELVLPEGHPSSFAAYMHTHVWSRSVLDERRFSIPDGASVYRGTGADLERLCAEVDARAAQLEPLDVALLGLGADGHVAYNLPYRVREETHVVELPDSLADELGVAKEGRPLRAVTLGFRPLRRARRLVLLVAGPEKAEAVGRLLAGEVEPGWPCTLLRDHPRFEIFADRDATALVRFQ